MKIRGYIAVILCIVILGFVGTVSAVDAGSEAAAAQVSVTSIQMDPEVFMEEDIGTITVEVTNSGTQSVPIHRASMYDSEINVISSPYEASTSVGAGNKMKFTFTVQADVPEGIYYPIFSINFRDAGSLRYPVKVQVQNAPLTLAVLDRPDTFSEGVKDRITILVGNPRDNQVNGISLTPEGTGFVFTPSQYFIGNLNPDQSVRVQFNVTPATSATMQVRADYMNGINPHRTDLEIPVALSSSKMQADPVLSNIQQKSEDGIVHITGDVTNAGLEVANSVVITMGGTTTPVDPYRNYVVGSLKPDDFSSFEVTFTGGNGTTPIITTFKDDDGNLFTKTSYVDVQEAAKTRETGSIPQLPIVIGIIILAAAIGGVILYSWRKR